MNKSFENKMSPALSMFNHIYKEFNEIYHEATLKIGLSDSAFNILYSIVDLGDGCSQSDICKYSCLSKQTVNSSIKKMASLNYLTFKPGKGRVMQIFLTDKGRQLLDEKIYPIIKKENEAFLCMTDEECRLMLELYKKYNNALKNKFKELLFTNGDFMDTKLAQHFTYGKLLKFVFPSIVMMVFTSIYCVVDGLFVSNFVGKTAFASINLIMPFIMGLTALGFMMGTGGSAIVAKTLGEGKPEKANEYFSLIVYTTIIGGLILSILGMFLVRPVSILLGAEGELLENCVLYGRITFISLTAFMLQNVFQSFFVTATKPKLGLAVIVSAGVTNMVLDYLFIAVLGFGLAGAAIATVCGELIGGLFPIFYFSRENSSLLKLGRTKFNGSILLKTCTNGSSELMTNLSSSVVNSLYNIQLLKFTGEDGVAAYGTIMYVSFIFVAIFIGYSIGSAPIISYNYGSGNNKELQNMSKKSLSLISIWAVGLFVLAQVISTPLATIFVGYDHDLFLLTRHGFRIYCVTFLINGFNIYGSAFFTALSNGLISATISFLRTLIFQIAAILILPAIFGINGIWIAVAMAELLTLCFTATFFIKQRKVYHY